MGVCIVSIERITVVGGGIMGSGIAQVVAAAGLEVIVVDTDETATQRALAGIDDSLARFVRSERLSQEQATAARARIGTSSDLDAVAAETDYVIEAVIEDFDAKRDVLRQLDRVCRADVIFASNTSQFSISRLASVTSRPDRVIGSHWFNPPPMMDLIEVVRGVETSQETLQQTLDLAERFGKRTVVCRKDTPGFITSRLFVTLAVEAMRIVEEGVADAEDVNLACQKAFNHAMGPLDTADFSGLDTTLRVLDNLRDQYGDRFLAPQSIRAMVNAGHLGRKTGRGFRDYGDRH
jgi:3-hydroxybutyryl-CoA dehydrogenase